MRVAVVDYGAGNVRSVMLALQRVGADPVFTADPEVVRQAPRVLLPGQGHAAQMMANLHSTGMAEVILQLTQPVLGICVGLQVLCSHSEEGDTPCLGLFTEQVVLLPTLMAGGTSQKLPHIGWNNLTQVHEGGPLTPLAGQYVYFLHSYAATLGPNTVAETHYGLPFSAALQRDNFLAVQFHPEKSSTLGSALLSSFIHNPASLAH